MLVVTEKIYVLECAHSLLPTTVCSVQVREFFRENGQTIFTWPGGVLLAAYIASHRVEFQNRRCLEIGCGTGLPSIVAAKVGARHCTLTERDDSMILENLRANVAVNGLDRPEHDCVVAALDWHAAAYDGVMGQFDVILGADVLYSSEDFDPVLATVAAVMDRHPAAVFITTYQERSTRRTLSPHLEKYGLRAETVPIESFLHRGHVQDGLCAVHVQEVQGEGGADMRTTGAGGGDTTRRTIPLSTFDSLLLIKISKQPAS
jgi:predicted nicotinamide N-methyase